MQWPTQALCPTCAMEFSQDADTCVHCGRELVSLRSHDKYHLVRDGAKFGIALRGRMVLGNMELKEAQSTLVLFNGEPSK